MRTIKINRVKLEETFGPDEAMEIIFDGKKSSAKWSVDAVNEVKQLHDIDIEKEIVIALIQELDFEFKLTEEEKANCEQEIKAHFI